MDVSDNPVYQKPVIDFITSANDLILCLEEAEFLKISDFIDKLNRILPKLYIFTLELPQFDARYEDFGQRFITEQDYNYLRHKLAGKLGQYDAFEEIFDKDRVEYEDTVEASIAEYLSDIYQDVKDFLLLYQIGSEEVMYEALYELYQSFINFWGQKLVNVLRAVHNLNFSVEELEENQEIKGSINYNKTPDTGNWIISRRQRDNQEDD